MSTPWNPKLCCIAVLLVEEERHCLEWLDSAGTLQVAASLLAVQNGTHKTIIEATENVSGFSRCPNLSFGNMEVCSWV